MKVPQRPTGIDFVLLKVRTDSEHTPAHLAPLLRVDRKHMADILEYVAYLENEYELAIREVEELKDEKK